MTHKHPEQLTILERRHRHIEACIQEVGTKLHRHLETQIVIEEKLESLLVKSKNIYTLIEEERNERENPESD